MHLCIPTQILFHLCASGHLYPVYSMHVSTGYGVPSQSQRPKVSTLFVCVCVCARVSCKVCHVIITIILSLTIPCVCCMYCVFICVCVCVCVRGSLVSFNRREVSPL